MEDSFSVRVKVEVASKAVKKQANGQTALCGLLLCQSGGTLDEPVEEIRIPERIADLTVQLFENEKIDASYSKGKLTFENMEGSALWKRCGELLRDFENSRLTTEEARRFLRGAFWGFGYCSDPLKNYRIEFVVQKERAASLISSALYVLSIKHICTVREGSFAVYFKNGDDVSDFLSYIGSSSAMMEFENVRAGKDVNGKVVRAVNCDEGNTKRQAEAAAARNEQITRLVNSGMINKLAPELREAALAQMENPGASLAELGAMMDPPIGKSGMRHRLDKIADIAKKLD